MFPYEVVKCLEVFCILFLISFKATHYLISLPKSSVKPLYVVIVAVMHPYPYISIMRISVFVCGKFLSYCLLIIERAICYNSFCSFSSYLFGFLECFSCVLCASCCRLVRS